MTTSLALFLPGILPECLGVPDIVAFDALKNSVIELAERGRIIHWASDPMALSPNVPEVEIETEDYTYLASIETVTLDGIPLRPRSWEQMDKNLPGWRKVQGTPFAFTRIDDITIRLVYTPVERSAGEGLVIQGWLAPTRQAVAVPDEFYHRWYRAVCNGAKAQLMMMPEKPWTNMQLATAIRSTFEEQVNHALRQSFSDHAQVELVARAPFRFA